MNGSGDEHGERRRRGRTEPDDSAEARIQEAVDRIEQAARDLSRSATDRAADYIEDVADRISSKTRRRAERAKAPPWPWSGQPRTPRLCRDREHGKLLGVCAGIASYYGLETWVVRLIALTGLVFLTSVTLVGYFVAALLMDPSPKRTIEAPSPHAIVGIGVGSVAPGNRQRTTCRRRTPGYRDSACEMCVPTSTRWS